jgi:S-formylglutathione hydrolase FrmB
MKKITLFLFLLAVSVCLFGQYNKIDTSFYSPSLGQEKLVDILLPPDYFNNPDEHYPVVYFLHGAGGNQNSYSGIYSHTYSMINNGTIHPIILVKPDGSVPPYSGSCYTNSIFYGNYEDYIVYDLTAWIDSTFRTIPERNFRCITGHSMGGLGSATLGCKHPDVYRGFASHGGTMNFDTTLVIWLPLIYEENGGTPPYSYPWGAGTYTNFLYTGGGAWSPNLNNPPTMVDYPLDENGVIIDSVLLKWRQHDICCVAKQVTPEDNLGIFFSCGTNDDHQLYPSNELFRDTLDMLGLDYVFLTTNGDHSLSPIMIYEGYKFLDSLMYSVVGMEENGVEGSRLKVRGFPNPTRSIYSIDISPEQPEEVMVQLYDLMGKSMINPIEMKISGSEVLKIDLSDKKPGIYLCKIQVGSETITKKVVRK